MSGSVTIAVEDPTDGTTLHFTLYRNKHGTLVVQSLDRNTQVALAGSPRLMEDLARVMETAHATFGERMTGDLPPGAEAVRVRLTGDAARNPVPSSNRKKLQREERLRLIGGEGLQLAERIVDSSMALKMRFIEPFRGSLAEGPSIPPPMAARVPLGQNPTEADRPGRRARA